MSTIGPAWDLWRTFDAVIREGSLSSAARALRLTQPTAGRHIAELEASLETGALFTRSARGLQPTEIARALLPTPPRWQRPPPLWRAQPRRRSTQPLELCV